MTDPRRDARFDPRPFAQARYRALAPQLAFPGGAPDQVDAWRRRSVAKLVELLGPFPAEKTPIQATVGEPVARPGYTRRTVAFETRPGLESFGYLLVPSALKTPASAVVCVPGHGRGVDDLVGILESGADRAEKDGYQHDFAIQCVERGHVALAIEPVGFGRRREEKAVAAGAGVSSCQILAGAALMLGETLLGWRVWDALRAIDFLETRPEVDPKRIGVIGISGGGTIALHAAAIDPRIRAAVLSCSFCTFRDSIYSINHCIDNFVPGVLAWFEAADLAAMIAPRGLFVEGGLADVIFPPPGVRAAVAAAETAYAALGASTRIDHELFDGGHVFHGVKALPRLQEWLEA